MMRTKDLTGRMFGRWVVLNQVDDLVMPGGQHHPAWLCECSCKNHTKKIVDGYSLIRGDTTSCGCYSDEVIGSWNKKYNNFTLVNDEYYIGYTKSGKEFYFDKDDYDKVSKYCWDVDGSHGYVKTLVKCKKLYLHKLVMNIDYGENIKVDHKNRHRNDCRKNNLQIATSCQNNMNMGVRSDNTSGIKGVYLDKRNGKFYSKINADKHTYNLGTFNDFTEAVLVRLEKEEELYKEFMTNDNRKILAHIRNGGELEYGNKELINKIINDI